MKFFVLGGTGKTGSHVVRLLGNESVSLEKARGVIEFSNPAACLEYMKTSSPNLFWVIGSTGWTASQLKDLTAFSKKRLILKSANFSLGVNIIQSCLTQMSPLLKKVGFKVEIRDVHHVHKKDAPSGTAIALKNTLTESGFSSVPIKSFRQGEIVGEHLIRFETDSEIISLKHEALDRSIFAQGAIEAARWLGKLKRKNSKKVGLLDMSDFIRAN